MSNKFNPTVQGAGDPNYIHYARSDNGNSAQGDLIRGIGGLFTKAADTVDTELSLRAKQAAVGSLQASPSEEPTSQAAPASSPDVATPVGVPGTLVTPVSLSPAASNPDIKDSVARASRLAAGRRNGSIGQTQYFAEVDANSKRIKAQYPGYSEDIDQMYQKAIGGTPANMYLASLNKDMNDDVKETKSEYKEYISFANTHQKYLPVDFYDRMQKGNPYDPLEIRKIVHQRIGVEADFDHKKAEIALEKEGSGMGKEKAMSSAISQTTNYVNTTLQDTAEATGFTKLINKAVESKLPQTPEEEQQLLTALRSWELKTEQGVDRILTEPFPDGVNSYHSIIADPSKIKGIREMAMNKFAIMKEAITNKDYGTIGAMSRMIEATKNSDTAHLMASDDAWRIQAAMNKNGAGPMALRVLDDSKRLPAAIQGVVNLKLSKMAIGEETSLSDVVRDTDKQMSKDPGANATRVGINGAIIDGTIKAMSAPGASIEAYKNVANALYGEKNRNFLSIFPPAKQTEYYEKMLSPEVQKKMVELKGADPQAYKMYQKWATESFISQFKTQVASANDLSKNSGLFNISFNKATGQFDYEVSSKASTEAKGSFSGFRAIWAGVTGDAIGGNYKALDDLNRQLKALAPVLKEDGKDAGEMLFGILSAAGFNPDTPKEYGFFVKLHNAMRGAYEEVGKEGLKMLLPREATGFEQGWGQQRADYQPGGETGLHKPDSAYDTTAIETTYDPFAGHGSMSQSMGTDKLLEVIGKAESNGSYDYSFGSKNKVKLTDKTIGEVLDHQGQMKKKGSPSTAVGKYQFLQSTLKGLSKELGLTGTEKFTEKLQDKLANALLNRRGYQKFLAGNITREDFVKRLSQEFAGLPGMNGKSYYHGDGLNASNVPLSELLGALPSVTGE